MLCIAIPAASQIPPQIKIVKPVTITAADYPATARRNGLEGDVRMLITLAPDGSVSECGILESSEDRALDDKSCELYRARAIYNATSNPGALRQTEAFISWRLSSGGAAVPAEASAAAFAFLDGFATSYPTVRLNEPAKIDFEDDCFEVDADSDACPLEAKPGLALLAPVNIVQISQIVDYKLGRVTGLLIEYASPGQKTAKAVTAKLGAACFTKTEAGITVNMWSNGDTYVIDTEPNLIIMSAEKLRSQEDIKIPASCL